MPKKSPSQQSAWCTVRSGVVAVILGTLWQKLGWTVLFEGRAHPYLPLSSRGLRTGLLLPSLAAPQVSEDSHTSFPDLSVHYLPLSQSSFLSGEHTYAFLLYMALWISDLISSQLY